MQKPITALYLVLPSSVIPMTLFVSYYFTPIDYCLDKLKKKYGYENEDQKHSVDADTRTLLQGVSCFGFIKKFYLADEIDY